MLKTLNFLHQTQDGLGRGKLRPSIKASLTLDYWVKDETNSNIAVFKINQSLAIVIFSKYASTEKDLQTFKNKTFTQW